MSVCISKTERQSPVAFKSPSPNMKYCDEHLHLKDRALVSGVNNDSSSNEGNNTNGNGSGMNCEEPLSKTLNKTSHLESTSENETQYFCDQKSKFAKRICKIKLSTTQDFNAKLRKRGILYISRIPPRMGPAKVKSLLSDFGNITRVYLVEEDKTVRKKRRKAGGSGSKRYVEGWVEFESKNVAKSVGETLNMTRISNHKRSLHYDDLWNVKYLKGFKWSHLTEKVAYERRVREQKLRVEMMEARRENAAYVAKVEAGKKLDHIEERRKRKMEKEVRWERRDHGVGDLKKRTVHQKKLFCGDSTISAKPALLGSLV